jgi:hypothetical protein
MLNCLQTYIELGFALFPYGQSSKKPINPHGYSLKYLEAGGPTLRMEQVKAWYEQYPGCAWGLATTDERGVLDIDPRHGGDRIIAEWEAKHGKLPPTWTVATGGGGLHKYFRFPPGTRSKELACHAIGIKAIDGGVILPPSRLTLPEHQGRAYEWLMRPWEQDIPDASSWLVEKMQAKPIFKPSGNGEPKPDDPWVVQPPAQDLLTHPGAGHGRKDVKRRPTLTRLVGAHLARGDSKASIEAMASDWASRCEPALTEDEWRKHVDGLWVKEMGKRDGQRHEDYTPFSLPTYNIPETVNERTNSDAETGGEFVRSDAVAQRQGEERGGVGQSLATYPQPVLSTDAYYGLFGEMLTASEPQTEAHPGAILLGWLTCFGNIVGRGAWFPVGPRNHYPCLYIGNVGETSAAKADGWAVALHPFRLIEPTWASNCIANGIGSGEGLLERVGDEQRLMTLDKKSDEVRERVIPGATDKRCLVRLSELSRCFKAQRRENSTLSEYLREMWDGEPVHIPNRRDNSLVSSDYAVSLFGDITPKVLVKALATGTEGFDGYANRFLWVKVWSPHSLPDGGDMSVLEPFLTRLAEALTFAKNAGQMKRDDGAGRLWHEVYADLKASGDRIPHTDRARPYAVRLSMLYALADQSSIIREEHLRAGLAVLDFCRESARLLFATSSDNPDPKPDALWLRVQNLIVRQPGINRSDIHKGLGGHTPAEQLTEALAFLEGAGLAHRKDDSATGGRTAERWYPGRRKPGPKEGLHTPLSFSNAEPIANERTMSEAQGQLVRSFASPAEEMGQAGEGGGVVEQPHPRTIASVQVVPLPDGPIEEGARTLPLASDEWVVKPEVPTDAQCCGSDDAQTADEDEATEEALADLCACLAEKVEPLPAEAEDKPVGDEALEADGFLNRLAEAKPEAKPVPRDYLKGYVSPDPSKPSPLAWDESLTPNGFLDWEARLMAM